MSAERWETHPLYPLAVSTEGRVRKLDTGLLVKGFRSGGGSSGPSTGSRWRPNSYRRIAMGKGYPVQNPAIHRLVLETFVGPCPEGFEGAHLNGDGEDNRLANLQWMREEENRGRRGRKAALV